MRTILAFCLGLAAATACPEETDKMITAASESAPRPAGIVMDDDSAEFTGDWVQSTQAARVGRQQLPARQQPRPGEEVGTFHAGDSRSGRVRSAPDLRRHVQPRHQRAGDHRERRRREDRDGQPARRGARQWRAAGAGRVPVRRGQDRLGHRLQRPGGRLRGRRRGAVRARGDRDCGTGGPARRGLLGGSPSRTRPACR